MISQVLLNQCSKFEHVRKISGQDLKNPNNTADFLDFPLLIAEAMDEWRASTLWNLDYIVSRLGHHHVVVSELQTTSRAFFKTTLSSFISLLTQDSSDIPYYTHFSDHLTCDMIFDYDTPQSFNCWYKLLPKQDQKLVLSWIYIGTKNSFSPLHVDVHNTSAWNAVFMGKKLWLFYPPDQIEYLYNGEVDPFNVNLKKYPKFTFAKPLVCIQKKGEIVFTPSGWWHCVWNLEKGFSLTENFINESNYEHVKSDFLSIGAKKAVEKLQLLKEYHDHTKR